MAVKGLLEGWFGGRLGGWWPRTPKLPRAPRNGDTALGAGPPHGPLKFLHAPVLASICQVFVL